MKVFSPPRRVLTERISKNGSVLGRNQSLFSPLIPLKAFLEIDYTESLPPLWITVAQFQSHFLQCKDMSIYSITLQGAKPGAWNIGDHPFLTIILCSDNTTSVWVLGIALLSQISVITLVILFFKISFPPINIKMHVWWNLKTALPSEVIQSAFNSLLCRFLQVLMITRTIIFMQCASGELAWLHGKAEFKCKCSA